MGPSVGQGSTIFSTHTHTEKQNHFVTAKLPKLCCAGPRGGREWGRILEDNFIAAPRRWEWKCTQTGGHMSADNKDFVFGVGDAACGPKQNNQNEKQQFYHFHPGRMKRKKTPGD